MKKLSLIVVLVILFSACKKSEVEVQQQSTFTLVNATTDIANARAYASENNIYWKPLPTADAAAQYRFTHMGARAGNNNIKAVSSADTTVSLFSSSKAENFEAAKASTLFLCGNTTAGYEAVFLNNESFVNHSDSVMGIRFINLSPNSSPVNITLSITPSVNEASALAYKQKTEFKNYPSLRSTGDIVFQLRDGGGVLLASYTLPVVPNGTYATAGVHHARFKNLTLVIKGLEGTASGTNAFGVFPVAHY
jgi:hypothetical protein